MSRFANQSRYQGVRVTVYQGATCMHRYFQFTLTGLTASALFIACEQSTTRQQSGPSITGPSFTAASGFASTLVARGLANAFHIRSTDGFDVEIKTKDNTDIAVSNVLV